jgi:hypothetical protein
VPGVYVVVDFVEEFAWETEEWRLLEVEDLAGILLVG